MEQPASSPPLHHPTLREALPVWVKIGLLSFGGPAGQIALMHRELVERRRWIDDERFLHALNYCMVLPGPEAQQLSIYLGWLQHGIRGGVIAGTLFVLPGALLMLAISFAYVVGGSMPWLGAVFYGLKAAVLALVAGALIRMGSKVLRTTGSWVIAGGAFAALFIGSMPLPWLMALASIIGLVFYRSGSYADRADKPAGPRPSMVHTVSTALIWVLIWLAPLLLALALLGPDHLLSQQGRFFAKAALITFGGAYSVLPYVAQHAVESAQWLTAAQMMDGLALAETTPGPLILVLQYVGFLGGWQQVGTGSPAALALSASVITSWMVFVPGFLFIFTGAPWIEYTRRLDALQGIMRAISATVLGIILNLSIWFGWHTLYPDTQNLDPVPISLGIVLLIAMRRYRLDALVVVAVAAATGLLLHATGLR